MTCPDENRLIEYVEGLLPDDGIRTIDGHIDQCASCRALLATFAHGSGDPAGSEAGLAPPKNDRYVIHEVVGTGAMSVVYAATDRVLERKVALKVLHGSNENLALRMQREARAMSQLAHPNVLTVFDIGVIDGRTVLTAELVQGQTVATWLEQVAPWRRVLEIFVQAARGLAAAHGAGITHRDFKPSNVLIGDDGRVRVADFGLARREVDPQARGESTIARDPVLSQTGEIVGTPYYMAPEQLAGAIADARSDQFSYCVALYEALYGSRPFRANDLAGLHRAIELGPEPAPKGRSVPGALRTIVVTGLALDPSRRHESMSVLADALERFHGRRRRAAGVLAGVAVLALTAGLVAFTRPRTPEPCHAPSWSGTWDAAHQQAIVSAFATGHAPFARDASHFVVAGLDRFTDKWSATYIEVCEATEVRHDRSARMLDLGMACLDERRAQAHALTELLLTADPRVVEHSVEAVDQLADLAACTDARLLSEQPDHPADLVSQTRLAGVSAAIARVKALQLAGEYREAIQLGRSLLEPARAVGYPPIEADLLVRIGAIYALVGDAKSAQQFLLDGLSAAEAAGDSASTALGATQLAYVTANFEQHFAEAHRWMQLASGASSKLGKPATAEANLASVRGAVALTEGDATEAQREYRRAAELRRQIGGVDDPLVAIAVLGLGIGYSRGGDDATALVHYDQALAMLVRGYGPSHPRVAEALTHATTALKNLERYEEANAKIREAIAIREQVFGAASPIVANSLLELAAVLQASGRNEESLPVAQRAQTIFETTSNDFDVSLALTSQGQGYRALGRTEDALVSLTKALAIEERVLGADHPDLDAALCGLGAVELDKQDYKRAAELFERAATNVEKAFGADSARLLDPLLGSTAAYINAGDPPHAIARAERALELARHQPTATQELGQASFLLAQALDAGHKDRARARELARAALADYATLGPAGAGMHSTIEAWLGQRR